MLRLMLFVLLCGGGIWGLAQSPGSRISVHQINVKYLEHLTKIKIDSVRKDHGLKPLVNDSILFVAAKDHAQWMNENKKFSHYEKTRLTHKTPQLRAEFHGAVNYLVGENIVKSYVNKTLQNKKGKKYINETYDQLANDFIDSWVHSPPHFANIISPDYEVTGLAIALNKERNLVYAVQKFAKVQFKYAFTENKAFFSYSNGAPPAPPVSSFDGISRKRIQKKYQWGIKAPRSVKDSSKTCDACNKAIDQKKYKDKLFLKGRKIVFRSYNRSMMDEIVRRRRDGLAVEFVPYEPVDCGNPDFYLKPSRRNNQTIINGIVTKPKYKKELNRGFKKAKYSKLFKIRKKGTAEYFELKLGTRPKNLNGYNEMNLLVLRRKRLCRVMHFSNYCGERMQDSAQFEEMTNLKPYVFVNEPKSGKIHFEIPFEQGKSAYQYEDIEALLGIFKETDFSIDSARIQAFSSLEGSEEMNYRLQLERGANVMKALASNQSTDFPKSIQAIPNWPLFHAQIEQEPALASLRGLEEGAIKQKLMDRIFVQEIEPFLKKQRVGVVDVHVKFKVKEAFLADTLMLEIKTILADERSEKLNQKGIDLILGMQYKIYELVKTGKAPISRISDLRSALQLKKHPYWQEQQIWIEHDLGIYRDQPKKLKKQLEALSQPSYKAMYSLLNLEYQLTAYQDLPEEQYQSLEVLMTTLQDHFPAKKKQLEQHRVKLYLEGISNGMDWGMKLAAYIAEMGRPESYNLQVAKHLLKLEKDMPAYVLLQWMIRNNPQLDETRGLFAKLSYYHSEEYHDRMYHESLIALFNNMNQENWCNLFVGPCNISFQVLDDEKLRNFYCEKCQKYPNYAQSPEKWRE